MAPWLDDTLLAEMEQAQVPGLVAIVVQAGRVIYRAGFGSADLERQIPVDVAHTRFRVGSLSKPFTAVALLRETDRGRLSLRGSLATELPRLGKIRAVD